LVPKGIRGGVLFMLHPPTCANVFHMAGSATSLGVLWAPRTALL
jgi:hypothetical protein